MYVNGVGYRCRCQTKSGGTKKWQQRNETMRCLKDKGQGCTYNWTWCENSSCSGSETTWGTCK